MTRPSRAPVAGEPDVIVRTDAEAVAREAAERVVAALGEAIRSRGRADWATTGGSTPGGIYRHLAMSPMRDAVDWAAVHLWWGDDRYVPRDHPLSNVQPADQILLAAAALAGQSGSGDDGIDVLSGREWGVPLPIENVHPFPMAEAIGERRGPAWAAARYEEELRTSGIASLGQWPAFDLVLAGVGPDGHILSVFPGSDALDERAEWALPIPAPTHVEPHVTRVTLNPRVLDAARELLVVIHGAAKAPVVETLFGRRDPRRWPAQLARRSGATWLLDEAAAASLRR